MSRRALTALLALIIGTAPLATALCDTRCAVPGHESTDAAVPAPVVHVHGHTHLMHSDGAPQIADGVKVATRLVVWRSARPCAGRLPAVALDRASRGTMRAPMLLRWLEHADHATGTLRIVASARDHRPPADVSARLPLRI